MKDLRFDMHPNAAESGAGIIYIVDSSNEGRTGFIMIDLGTGENRVNIQVGCGHTRMYQAIKAYRFYSNRKAVL